MKKLTTAAIALASLLLSLTPAYAAEDKKYQNCKALNKIYPGGVSKNGATDMTKKNGKAVKASPKKVPTIDDAGYKKNKGLDRDKDGVACEK